MDMLKNVGRHLGNWHSKPLPHWGLAEAEQLCMLQQSALDRISHSTIESALQWPIGRATDWARFFGGWSCLSLTCKDHTDPYNISASVVISCYLYARGFRLFYLVDEHFIKPSHTFQNPYYPYFVYVLSPLVGWLMEGFVYPYKRA